MAATHETIELEIKHKASGAASEIKKVTSAIHGLSASVAKSLSPMKNFLSSLKRIAYYRFIRTIIKTITQAFTEGLQAAYAFSTGISDAMGHRFAQAMDNLTAASKQMKGQLGSAFISLLAAIEPILIRILNLITRVVDAISQLFAAFTGTTYLKSNESAATFADTMQHGAASAKEWKNQLLGFDEINRLNEPSKGGGGSGSNPLAGYNFQDTPLDDWAMKIHDNLTAIEMAAGGFELGLGLILTFSGANIPLGLGLIALGAYKIITNWSSENWGLISERVGTVLADIMGIIAGALLAIGVILLLTGNVGIGIGCILAGVAFGVASVKTSWETMPKNVETVLTRIMVIVGGALLGLGIIITFATPSFSAVGLALIVAGAASIVSAVAVNWDFIGNKVKRVIAIILGALGLALGVVGIVLCFNPATIGLGLALLFAGFAAEYGALTFDDGALLQAVESACQAVWNIVKGLFVTIWDEFVGLIDGIIEGLNNVYNWDVWEGGRSYNPDGTVNEWEGMNFASGGFPDEGQLFFAREAGPELVGTMGGRTAVANNQEITEGIRQAVYDAFVAANGDGRDVSVRVYLDSQEIKVGQERLDRAWGV